LFFISLITSCKNNRKSKEDFKYEDYFIQDCNLYKMIFAKGDYILRFATAGYCLNITIDDYISEFNRFYSQNNTINKKEGKIIFDINKSWDKKYLQDSLISIVKKYSKREVFINKYESYDTRIIINVGNVSN
jgi:hypothetical protein